jgi:hypothetical protein
MERFLVDEMLGALARNLRMLGYDAASGSGELASLAQRAAAEGRWLITRRPLGEGKPLAVETLRILPDEPERQIVHVLRAVGQPPPPSHWFGRCLRCNRLLEEMAWKEALDAVPEYVARTHRRFRRCAACGRVFWAGTHRERMCRRIHGWLREARFRGEEKP